MPRPTQALVARPPSAHLQHRWWLAAHLCLDPGLQGNRHRPVLGLFRLVPLLLLAPSLAAALPLPLALAAASRPGRRCGAAAGGASVGRLRGCRRRLGLGTLRLLLLLLVGRDDGGLPQRAQHACLQLGALVHAAVYQAGLQGQGQGTHRKAHGAVGTKCITRCRWAWAVVGVDRGCQGKGGETRQRVAAAQLACPQRQHTVTAWLDGPGPGKRRDSKASTPVPPNPPRERTRHALHSPPPTTHASTLSGQCPLASSRTRSSRPCPNCSRRCRNSCTSPSVHRLKLPARGFLPCEGGAKQAGTQRAQANVVQSDRSSVLSKGGRNKRNKCSAPACQHALTLGRMRSSSSSASAVLAT